MKKPIMDNNTRYEFLFRSLSLNTKYQTIVRAQLNNSKIVWLVYFGSVIKPNDHNEAAAKLNETNVKRSSGGSSTSTTTNGSDSGKRQTAPATHTHTHKHIRAQATELTNNKER